MVDMLLFSMEKNEFPFFEFPYFRVLPQRHSLFANSQLFWCPVWGVGGKLYKMKREEHPVSLWECFGDRNKLVWWNTERTKTHSLREWPRRAEWRPEEFSWWEGDLEKRGSQQCSGGEGMEACVLWHWSVLFCFSSKNCCYSIQNIHKIVLGGGG